VGRGVEFLVSSSYSYFRLAIAILYSTYCIAIIVLSSLDRYTIILIFCILIDMTHLEI